MFMKQEVTLERLLLPNFPCETADSALLWYRQGKIKNVERGHKQVSILPQISFIDHMTLQCWCNCVRTLFLQKSDLKLMDAI